MLLNVYYSRISSCRYVFPDGSEAAFIGGRYTTEDKNKAAQLNLEVELGHPHIFIDPNMRQMDSADLDPMEVLRKKIIAEAIASGELQRVQTSTSEAEQLKPASSANLVDVKTAEEAALGIAAGEQVQLQKEISSAKPVDLKNLLKK